MTHNSSAGRRLVEALYDPKSGTTFVRHPERENEWVASDLIDKMLKGHPVASITGHDDCDVFASVSHQKTEPKKMTLALTSKSVHGKLE